MNVNKLRRLAKVVANSPVEMDKWTCGTAACVNGWNMRLEGLIGEKNGWTEKGRKLMKRLALYGRPGTGPQHASCSYDAFDVQKLGELTLELSGKEATRLFYIESWPSNFQQMYEAAPKFMRGPITAARIEHFIQTAGSE